MRHVDCERGSLVLGAIPIARHPAYLDVRFRTGRSTSARNSSRSASSISVKSPRAIASAPALICSRSAFSFSASLIAMVILAARREDERFAKPLPIVIHDRAPHPFGTRYPHATKRVSEDTPRSNRCMPAPVVLDTCDDPPAML